jgi:TonB family protein
MPNAKTLKTTPMQKAKSIIVVALVLGLYLPAFSQAERGKQEAVRQGKPQSVGPEFPGGFKGLDEFIATNKTYPLAARNKNIKGDVIVGFLIDTTGAVVPESVQVMRSVHPSLDQEAVRIIHLMPQWKPARFVPQNKAVESHFSIKIQFNE